MVGFVKELESLERWYMYVFNYKAMCLVQQGTLTNILLCLIMHWQLFVYGSMMQGIAMKKRLSWNLEEGLGWAFLWNIWEPEGVESWCLLLVLWFVCAWFMVLIASSACSCHFVYGVVLLLIFYLVASWYCLLCFEGIRSWLWKRKLMELGERLIKPNR